MDTLLQQLVLMIHSSSNPDSILTSFTIKYGVYTFLFDDVGLPCIFDVFFYIPKCAFW